MILTFKNFMQFATQNYINFACVDEAEFIDDVSRATYIKKLFGKYKKNGELKDRLIMNHIVVMFNVFRPQAVIKMLFLELDNYKDCLVPFLIALNYLPETVEGIFDENYYLETKSIVIDHNVANIVKKSLREGI